MIVPTPVLRLCVSMVNELFSPLILCKNIMPEVYLSKIFLLRHEPHQLHIHLTQDEKLPRVSTTLCPGWCNPRHAMNGMAMLTKTDQSGWLDRSLFQQAAPCFNTGWNRYGQRVALVTGKNVRPA